MIRFPMTRFFAVTVTAVTIALGIGLVAPSDARARDGLSLNFTSFGASPVVLTGFAVEQPLAPIPPELIAGAADTEFPRLMGGRAVSAPSDAKRDGKWVISAQWVELATDKAWTARAEIPISALTFDETSYTLLLVFGPNGEMLIGSDRFSADPSARVDVARVCGTRLPQNDKAWRKETGYFPALATVLTFMKTQQRSAAKPVCAAQ